MKNKEEGVFEQSEDQAPGGGAVLNTMNSEINEGGQRVDTDWEKV
jgi:hypothetical protein